MKPTRAAILLFVPLLLSLCLFTACGEKDETTVPEDQVSAETISGGIHIAPGEETDFMVIRGDTSEDRVTKAAVELRSVIEEKVTGKGNGPGIATDWEKNPVYPHEFIVGPTLRPGDADIDRLALGETGYTIREKDGCVYICGGSGKGTALGVNYFIKTFISKDGSIDVPAGFECTVYHEYDIPALYIAMNPVEKGAVIAIPNAADSRWKRTAETLQDAVYRKTGIYPAVQEGKQGTFVLSDTPAAYDGANEITAEDGSLVFRSSSGSGIEGCVNSFISEYLNHSYGCYNFPSDFHYLQAGDDIIIRYPEGGQNQ
ncbi:MAG: hypothetical protein MJ175_10390 [Clostridia bacterium]|nr:hypothetical protein [Clostridia bacterium]